MLRRKIALAALALCALASAPAQAECTVTNDARTLCSGSTLPPAQRSTHRNGRHHERRVASVGRHHSPGGGACPYSLVQTAAGTICISSNVAERMKGFIADAVARGYSGGAPHCYSMAKSHVRNSLHKIAEACDFAQRGWGRTVKPMYNVADLTAKWGLRNGCSFGDCGHVDSGRVREARHWPRVLARN